MKWRAAIFSFVEPRTYPLETSAPKPTPRSYKVKRSNEFRRTGNRDLTLSELAIMLHGPPPHELRHSRHAEPTACSCLPSTFSPVSSPVFDSFYPSSSSSSGFFPRTSSTTIPSSSPSSTHSSSDLYTYPCVEHRPNNGMVTEDDLSDSSFTNVTPLSEDLSSQSSLPPKPTSRPPAIRHPSPPQSRLHSPPVNSHVSCSMPNPIPCPPTPLRPASSSAPPPLTNSSEVSNISCACEDRRPPVLPRRRRLLSIEDTSKWKTKSLSFAEPEDVGVEKSKPKPRPRTRFVNERIEELTESRQDRPSDESLLENPLGWMANPCSPCPPSPPSSSSSLCSLLSISSLSPSSSSCPPSSIKTPKSPQSYSSHITFNHPSKEAPYPTQMTDDDACDSSLTDVTPRPDYQSSKDSLLLTPVSTPRACARLSPQHSPCQSPSPSTHIACSLLTPLAHPRPPNPPEATPQSSIKFTSLPTRLSTAARFRWRPRLRQLFRNLCCWSSQTRDD
ncbi:hypothetical protein SprV_0902655200 [Sparganum proliferum]